jgi:hypothetical protein
VTATVYDRAALSSRPFVVVSALVSLVVLAGCYGSTEPATDIGPESATLNGAGTADNGGVSVRFDYEVSGRTGEPQQIQAGHYPAGSSGPVKATIEHLAANTIYTFRMCGLDDGEENFVCAQTRTFTTRPASEDSVYAGWFGGCCAGFTVAARSGPEGQNPRGTMSWRRGPTINDQTSFQYSGIVTCLVVNGPNAAIGSRGVEHIEPSGEDVETTMLATVVDGRTQLDSYHTDGPGSGDDCANASFEGQVDPGSQFEFVVNDAVVAPQ